MLMTVANYSQKHQYAVPVAQKEVRTWQFHVPPEDIIDTKLQLLTINGISLCGYWQGECGEFFSAWSLDVAQVVQ